MKIEFERRQKTLVVSLAGSFDALTAGQVQSHIGTKLAAGQSQVILDLGRVDFMSSSGVRVLLDLLKRTRELGGDTRLAAAQPGVQRTLDISGLVRVLKAYPTVDGAVHSFGAQ